jgi:hypothetical protein
MLFRMFSQVTPYSAVPADLLRWGFQRGESRLSPLVQAKALLLHSNHTQEGIPREFLPLTHYSTYQIQRDALSSANE